MLRPLPPSRPPVSTTQPNADGEILQGGPTEISPSQLAASGVGRRAAHRLVIALCVPTPFSNHCLMPAGGPSEAWEQKAQRGSEPWLRASANHDGRPSATMRTGSVRVRRMRAAHSSPFSIIERPPNLTRSRGQAFEDIQRSTHACNNTVFNKAVQHLPYMGTTTKPL